MLTLRDAANNMCGFVGGVFEGEGSHKRLELKRLYVHKNARRGVLSS